MCNADSTNINIVSYIFSFIAENFHDTYRKQEQNQWFQDGIDTIRKNLKLKPIEKKAKGVILFLGDGMGISTVTAGRILDGQLKGQTGKFNCLQKLVRKSVRIKKNK